MNKISNMSKVGIVAVIAATLIVLSIVYGTGSYQGTISQGNNDQSTSFNAVSPTQTPTQTSTPTSSMGRPSAATTRPPAPPTIHFVTPVKNDIWKIGSQDLISWDRAGNFSGSISILDATTKQSIGVILPQIGTKQTSYTWNTRDVLISRTDPLKKNILPGTYVLRIF